MSATRFFCTLSITDSGSGDPCVSAAAAPAYTRSQRIPGQHASMTRTAASLVRVGDCVTLAKERRFGVPDSEGGTAFVSAVHDDGTFDVRYVLGLSETNVAPRRIEATNPLAVPARRVSNESLERPSLLAPSHRPESRSQA